MPMVLKQNLSKDLLTLKAGETTLSIKGLPQQKKVSDSLVPIVYTVEEILIDGYDSVLEQKITYLLLLMFKI